MPLEEIFAKYAVHIASEEEWSDFVDIIESKETGRWSMYDVDADWEYWLAYCAGDKYAPHQIAGANQNRVDALNLMIISFRQFEQLFHTGTLEPVIEPEPDSMEELL
jgi:hypothetical protein